MLTLLCCGVFRRQRLALDIISAVPFDWIAYGIAAAVATAAVASGQDPADAAAAAAATTAAAAAAAAAGSQVATAGAGAAITTAAATAATAAKGGSLLTAAHAAAGLAGPSHLSALSTAAGGAWQGLASAPLSASVPAIACLKGLHLVRKLCHFPRQSLVLPVGHLATAVGAADSMVTGREPNPGLILCVRPSST